MNQMEMEAKVKEVFSDKEYVKEVLELETPEEVQASLKEKGIELTINDIMQIKKMLEKREDGELTDEDLEDVNGGFVLFIITAVFWVGLAGTISGIGITDSVMRRKGRRW